jgi:hypothetical protein
MTQERQVYRLKVSLRSARPPIWRRIQVLSDITLFELHKVLQTVMGWSGSHLHQFQRKGIYYGESDPDFGMKRESEKRVHLNEVLEEPKDRMIYEYDFGDSWEHEVLLEAVEERDPNMAYPVVLAGKRACPPEDVGGIPGYYEFLEALNNPKHPEHRDTVEWLGGPFDPEAFDIDSVNRLLHRGRRTKKTTD